MLSPGHSSLLEMPGSSLLSTQRLQVSFLSQRVNDTHMRGGAGSAFLGGDKLHTLKGSISQSCWALAVGGEEGTPLIPLHGPHLTPLPTPMDRQKDRQAGLP